MPSDSFPNFDPYHFRGGMSEDYGVGVGPSGTAHTIHRHSRQVIQCVEPRSGDLAGKVADGIQMANVLGAANLGVNLLNLGVGLHNAHQIGEVRKTLENFDVKIDIIRGDVKQVGADVRCLTCLTAESFARVENVLQSHGVVLGILVDGQVRISERLALLSEEIRAGFADILHSQISVEARAVRRELEARSRTAVLHYRAVRDKLVAESRPSVHELRSVIDSSMVLLGWIDTMVSERELSDPARLPLLALRTAALHMLTDARNLEDASHGINENLARELADEVSNSAYALCNGRTPWDLAHQFAPIVGGYLSLLRGLSTRAEFGVRPDGELVPLLPIAAFRWSDSLDALRETAQKIPGVPLDEVWTAQDLGGEAWLAKWREEVAGGTEPTAEAILRRVGANDLKAPGRDSLEAARALALAEGRRALGRHLEREFGWKSTPRILPGGP